MVFHQKVNLLCADSLSPFGFTPALVDYLQQQARALVNLSQPEEDYLLERLVHQALVTFSQANQFYHFNAFDRESLKKVYQKLLNQLKELPQPIPEEELQQLARRHYRILQGWLKKTNPFAKALYTAEEPYLAQEVVCEEYSAAAQLQLLGIDPAKLQEPILDLGCGQQAYLVHHLRNLGLEAYGIDRNVSPGKFLFQTDWFEFNVEDRQWGTILSNVGFSNHFRHHHLRVSGDYTAYASRYRQILLSLKREGVFYYAPDLPFVEQHLPLDEFKVQKQPVPGTSYHAAAVVRL